MNTGWKRGRRHQWHETFYRLLLRRVRRTLWLMTHSHKRNSWWIN
jgi:hypothetical protein